MKEGPLVDERIVRLVRDGQSLFEWRCTPADLEALVIGRLYSEGLIQTAAIAAGLRIVEEGAEILVELKAPLGSTRHKRTRLGASAIPDNEVFTALYKTMFAVIDERHPEGGIHGAALVKNNRIVVQAEDVGRHNAVDKAIGLGLLAGADIAAKGMIVTSRVSGEIARKAAHSAVAWLASRSIPTTLAVSIARIDGMPIIGRAAGRHAFVYR